MYFFERRDKVRKQPMIIVGIYIPLTIQIHVFYFVIDMTRTMRLVTCIYLDLLFGH